MRQAAYAAIAVSIALLMTAWVTRRDSGGYRRADWGAWTQNGDCADTRTDVLVRDAVPGSLVFLDARKCSVVSGRWLDAYTGDPLTDPALIDVDHVVPLRRAHEDGGSQWPRDKKIRYTNDLGYPGHLVVTSRRVNQSKGDRGPEAWRPASDQAQCRHAERWASIKASWGLTIRETERRALRELLLRC